MIGIDVGGANLKVVNDDGAHIHYCPLWEEAPLTSLLNQYVTAPDEPAAVVMSGELADCFESKMEGISFIVNAVKNAFHSARFYGTDGQFHDGAVPQLAAANWLASADYLRAEYPDAVLLDIGSTTADIIPLACFEIIERSYRSPAGSRRGISSIPECSGEILPPCCNRYCLIQVETPVSSEYFAASADAHLVLGHITPAQYTVVIPRIRKKRPRKQHFAGLPGLSVRILMRSELTGHTRLLNSSGKNSGA